MIERFGKTMLLARAVLDARERGEPVTIVCAESSEKQFKRHLELLVRGLKKDQGKGGG